MRGTISVMSERSDRWWPALALILTLGLSGRSRAEAPASPAPPGAAVAAAASPPSGGGEAKGEIVQTGCASCGGGLVGGPGGGGCASCGGCGAPCYPGREGCDCCADPKTPVGRLFYGIYECICCPDPCYEPRWNILGNAAFFADETRPVTGMRIRTDGVWNFPFPDKAEYFWARADGKGKMQRLPKDASGNIVQVGERNLDYGALRLYTEGAIQRFSFFLEFNYLDTDPDVYPSASGFGDMLIGTKSLLLDCELLQFTFQFKTFIPTGNFTQGIGTGHTSLEPSLLFALKLMPSTFLQGQVAYLFPIGGDLDYQGSVVHYHLSLNQMLWHCGKDIELVGTLEANGYNFLNGDYTIPTPGPFPNIGAVPATVRGRAESVGNIFSIGPGVRLNICNKIDFGVGSAFAVTNDSIGDVSVRADFRWRF
jgi:hypothetical protein